MNIIIAFVYIDRDRIEVSGQILIMHICYNDRNLDFNLIPALCDLVQWFFFLLLLSAWRELQYVQHCRDLRRRHRAPRIPEDAQSHTAWTQVESFFSIQVCAWVPFHGIDSISSCTMYNISTRVSVKVAHVIVVIMVLGVKWRRLDWFLMTWKFLVSKNQSSCLNFQNSSTHVQH